MQPEWDAFMKTVVTPTAQARLKFLLAKGLQKPGDLEEHLNHYTAAFSN